MAGFIVFLILSNDFVAFSELESQFQDQMAAHRATTSVKEASSQPLTPLSVLSSTSRQSRPYASSSGEAFRICCYSALCSFSAINDCSILSPEGKIIAFVGMALGGVTGFALGSSLAASVYGVVVNQAGPFPVYEVPSDDLLSLSFLSAGFGFFSGALIGAMGGLIYDGTLTLLFPRPKRRQTRSRQSESPPPAPSGDPPPAF